MTKTVIVEVSKFYA